ncbi:glycosyl transferase group 1 [Methylocella silvestris BL2]|uniref:Glycosyl transferase group 1 n=1 Tax=Methylocella silvestris (strain DSM 15510 / CIP 108128 / LMG 27833 / NCIMB 13906 / BL2) TaxID=395965 RepID=B8EPT4_METSB|nr:MSMEG_0565 family glycosyltransferase [Methylocella silvestris]ACK50938.1 glycosyl transferase group 1 [Methylocella silvestris BL2]
MRIAILAHSTNPRGGVVHALALGDALTRLGHGAVVHAPDAAGAGFFRKTLCDTILVPATPSGPGVTGLVERRVADYVRHFEAPAHRRFDVYHAQDGISGNALATLKQRGLIRDFIRTVHHIDDFADPRLRALQKRSITQAGRHLVVSHAWRNALAHDFGVEAAIVGNGVDRRCFSPARDGSESALRENLGLGAGPVFLSIGGVEARKNSLCMLRAFARLQRRLPSAQLVIAGGASLLDHDAYQRQFSDALTELRLPPGAVIRTGPLAQAVMPALYRLADGLVFASLKEGFGLAVLEAMACGVPVIVSEIAPFTEYLGPDDAAWCDPLDVDSIARAMTAALRPQLRAQLIENGFAAAARHDWDATAQAHLASYESLKETADA